jgi:hypothetical protein
MVQVMVKGFNEINYPTDNGNVVKAHSSLTYWFTNSIACEKQVDWGVVVTAIPLGSLKRTTEV